MKNVHLEVTMMKRIGELNAENARLKAEVERLTKAGDNLEDILTDRVSSQEVRDATRQWDDAKSNKAP